MLASYNVNGYFSQCEDCKLWVDPTDYTTHEGLCADCAAIVGWYYCADCKRWFKLDDLVEFDGFKYCDTCIDFQDALCCEDCGDWYAYEDCREYAGNNYCEDCFDKLGLSFCDGCNEYHEDCFDCDGTWYCDDCARAAGYARCCNCCTWTNDSHCTDYDVYCSECFYDHYTYCDHCGSVVEIDDCISDDDGTFCDGCYNGPSYSGFRNMTPNPHDRVGSTRRYGVELETANCSGYDGYNNAYWKSVYDGSISGKEFVSSVLIGDDGFDAISDLCKYADTHDWRVSDACGYHLHIDVSTESADSLKAIAFAYKTLEEVWNGFIDSNRKYSYYCQDVKHDSSDYMVLNSISDWRRFASQQNRYRWINWASYTKHGSLEVRCHHATLDDTAICNWISAHLAFVDWAVKVGCAGIKRTIWGRDRSQQLDQLYRIWDEAGCAHLIDYYKEAVCA